MRLMLFLFVKKSYQKGYFFNKNMLKGYTVEEGNG